MSKMQTAAITRKMDGAIYWPNGMGYRECTAQYEEAYEARQAAHDALRACDEWDAAYTDLYYAYETTQSVLAQLINEGGHIGEAVHFEARDPVAALLGGGRIRVYPVGKAELALAA